MKVRALALVFVLVLGAAACVDGKTPDCTSVDSGCSPEDSGTITSDASDANNASDTAKSDGPTPVTDASTDAATD